MARINPKNILKNLEPWQDPSAKPYLIIEDISKYFGSVQAVKHLSLQIFKGELFALLGGSGCGKSTLLRILAGLETPSSGRIILDGIDITNLPPYNRPVSMMFQSYALFPHMTVAQNICFGLNQEKLPAAEVRERLDEMLDLVQLRKFHDRKPDQLSGGQKQRVALARSLAKHPKLLLLDEPLGALDKKLREKTQFELVNIQERVGTTFVMVTHDQEEAMTMSSRMGIMDDGQLRQLGKPQEVYEYPNCKFVADFIGAMNIVEGLIIEDASDHVVISTSDMDCKLYATASASLPLGSSVSVAIRPEKIFISKENKKKQNHNRTSGIITEIAYLGDISIYYVRLDSGKIIQASLPNSQRSADQELMWDDEVFLSWSEDSSIVLSV